MFHFCLHPLCLLGSFATAALVCTTWLPITQKYFVQYPPTTCITISERLERMAGCHSVGFFSASQVGYDACFIIACSGTSVSRLRITLGTIQVFKIKLRGQLLMGMFVQERRQCMQIWAIFLGLPSRLFLPSLTYNEHH